MRIAIVGNSGSGKSTLARALATTHGLAMLDLDTIAWEPNQVAVPRADVDQLADLRAFCAREPRWVIEGCYAGLIQAAFSFSPRLIFMDPGVDACLDNCHARPWEPHKYASKAEQDAKLEFLLAWVREYDTREGDLGRGAHVALFENYGGEKYHLRTRAEADALLHAVVTGPASRT
jgi:adenylate kinase family enzyme